MGRHKGSLNNKPPRASQIKQYIIENSINGETKENAYKIAFNKPDIGYRTAHGEVIKLEKTEAYRMMKPAITDTFIKEVTDATKEAAVNYMKKYNSMLEEGDKFIRESDGEMKLKAFANQRALMESNPFSVIQKLQEVNKPAAPALPEGDDESIIIN